MAENEINKVQVLIRRFLFEVDGIIHDPSACQAWLQSFCKTLQFQDLCKEPNQYALFLLDEARAFNIEQRRKSQMKQVRRALAEDGLKNPTQEQLDEKWLEMYGNEESPQDAPNGNAGVDMHDARNGAASKSPTSCDQLTADGDIREDSRGRYAPPSCSPDDGNPAETAPSHGGSVASLEARQGQALESQRRAGADSVRGTPSHRAPARSPARKFRNKEEFIQWAIDTGLDPDDAGNCWEATMERGGLTKDGKKVENLCAYAVKWCRTSKKNRETA